MNSTAAPMLRNRESESVVQTGPGFIASKWYQNYQVLRIAEHHKV